MKQALKKMIEIKNCVYDNPATMSRELWQNGRLICSYYFATLPPFAKCPIPSGSFHMGANIGDWWLGQIHGDSDAMLPYYSIIKGVKS